MTTGLGLNGGLLAFGKESTYGTAVARTNLVCMNSDGLAVEEEEILSECLHGDFNDIDDNYRGNISAGGDVEIEMRYEGSELLFENLLGTKTTTELAGYVIDNTNNKIDFKEDGGSELTATLTSGSYILGASSATDVTLCKEIKTQLEAAGAGTYTVSYSRTTKKITIAVSGGASAVQFLWNTGTNKLVSPATKLGFLASADSASAGSIVADNTIESVYKHSFIRSAATNSLQVGLTMESLIDSTLSTAKSKLYSGCMINSMDISIEAGGKLMSSMNILAQEESLLDTETVTALAYTKKPIALASQGILSYGGSEETLVNSFSCTLGMNLKDDRYCIGSNNRKKPIPNGKIEITGTMELEFEGKAKYDDFRNNSTKSISITFTGTSMIVGTVPYSITFSFPYCKLQGSTPQISDSGLIVVEIPFRANGEDINNKGVVVELVNSVYLA